jgi:YVTN family beta-propeller protein
VSFSACVWLAVAGLALHWVATVRAEPIQPLPQPDSYFSPSALAATRDGKTLFIACATANRILCLDIASRTVLDTISVPEAPSGLALSSDERRLFLTCAAPQSVVCMIDVARMFQPTVSAGGFNAPTFQRFNAATPSAAATTPASPILDRISTGHSAMAPVIGLRGTTLFVCNRFNNSVDLIDLTTGREVSRIPVRREPVAAALTMDGKHLLVANHLHNEAADSAYVSAVVSVIDLAKAKVTAEFLLPDGSGALKDIRVSPDGKYAAVTHILAQYRSTAANLRFRWMNANALTVIDMTRMEIVATTLLDDRGRGAANPWGIAWSADGSILAVAHAGTHEVSIIDWPILLKKLLELPAPFDSFKADNAVHGKKEPMGYAVPFFVGSRCRVKLPATDLGPRAIAIVGHTLYAANYFSDTLTALDLNDHNVKPESISLSKSGPRNPKTESDLVRRGEFYFHDANICFQGWQSCSSCHPGDGRADGLNWDLLNDGIGNPKNTKSLLLAFQTPPAMWLGVRETAQSAVRAGLKGILLAQQPEEVAVVIDEYIKSLKPVPSPNLVNGKFSESGERGQGVFRRAGCAACHPPPLFTDLHQYDVGTGRQYDKPADRFDTPSLVELWRTAPYLHDGSAATVRDVLTTRNLNDQHGKTSNLTPEEIFDLCAYLLSL